MVTTRVIPPSAVRSRGQAGAASGEQVGVIVVAALLVLALLGSAGSWGQDLVSAAARAICAITDGDCALAEDGGQEEAGPDLRPMECQVGSTTDGYSTQLKIAFITIGENKTFVLDESIERQEDGTGAPKFVVTATDGGALGAETGVGGRGRFGDSDFGASIDVGGEVQVNVGDQWEFSSEQEYLDFKEQWDAYERQMMMMQQSAMHGGFYFPPGGFVDPPRGPDYTTTSVGLEGALGLLHG